MAYIVNPSFALQQWSITVTTAVGSSGTPTVTRAAGAAGVRHVARRVIISIGTSTPVQPPVVVNLRDGGTGAGTVLATFTVSLGLITALSGVNSQTLDLDNLHLVGTAATAMCIEAAAATAAGTAACLTLLGYDISNTN